MLAVGFQLGFTLGLIIFYTPVSIVPRPCSAILDILDGARDVRLAVFTFSLYDGSECTDRIARKLVSIARSGGRVEVFLDDSKSNREAIAFFAENNVPVYVFKGRGTLHAKVILADRCFVLGSSNYTKSGFFRNAEINVKICGPPSEHVRAWFDALRSRAERVAPEDVRRPAAPRAPRSS